MNLEQNIMQIPIEDIIPNRFQPRLTFDDRGLEELANSIKQHGIIQPLVLRRIGDKYEIIAGERRYKAATIAGLSKVPAVIANIDDNKSAEVAIVENVQRRDLTPIEEARSYKNLLDKGYLTQAELAKKMGISQSAIANKLRLLNLDSKVQDALLNNKISERHARSLLVLDSPEEQREWLERIIKERMTVRELDEALKKKATADDDTDIPLVKNLDIEAIKKEATELPNISEDSDIARKLAEIEREKMYNPDVVLVDQASNNSKSNFFNFLENETVNMNTEDISLKAPAIDFELPTINKKEEEPKQEESEIEEIKEDIVEEKELPVLPIELPKKEIEEPSIFNSNFGTPPNITKEESNDDDFDPINLIETLDPTYEAKVEEQMGLDLKTAINAIRDTKDTLSDKGFKLNMEETDLPDSYQFIIKIKKN
ncbi:MAG: ParB/RepB/Spo0J family partition protein [Ruminococcus sp.]|nr:ParB/RepB/Spo0J family partition protein [Ruminococcus sp.]